MKLTVIGSNSMGNAYILEHNGSQILLDAGMDFNSIKTAFNYNFSKLEGVFLTHEHGDHSRSIKNLLQLGITCYGLKTSFENLKIKSPLIEYIDESDIIKLKGFTITALPAKHDCPILSYIIDTNTHKLLFLTDTCIVPEKIKNITGINTHLIEANYDSKILESASTNDNKLAPLNNRIKKAHLSIEKTLQFLEDNYKDVKQIILIHLSENNSDEKDFVERVQRLTGKPTYVATKNFSINL